MFEVVLRLELLGLIKESFSFLYAALGAWFSDDFASVASIGNRLSRSYPARLGTSCDVAV